LLILEKGLRWKAIDFLHKTRLISDKLRELRDNLPNKDAKDFKKLTKFLDELNYLLNTMERINTELIPRLEKKLRIGFSTPELVMFSLTRPSIKNIFTDIQTYFIKNGHSPIDIKDFDNLASTGDAANVLALLGDAVLDLATIEMMWDSSLSTVGDLTAKRKALVSNKNLASWCDSLELYKYKLQRLNVPSRKGAKHKTIEHEKGTLVEALLGVIYIENGYNGVLKSIPYLRIRDSDS